MNPFFNMLINLLLVLISMLYFTCEKQKKSSILIVFLSFSTLAVLNSITGTTAYIFKVFQLIFLFCIALVCYKQNYKNVITGIFISLAIQSLSVNIPFILRFFIDQSNFINEMSSFIDSSILVNILFILIFILMIKLLDISALKRYIQESNITYIYATYIVALYILLYFQYYFLFEEYDYIIKIYINCFSFAIPIVILVHSYIKLSSYKIASELNEQIEVYNHEKNKF